MPFPALEAIIVLPDFIRSLSADEKNAKFVSTGAPLIPPKIKSG